MGRREDLYEMRKRARERERERKRKERESVIAMKIVGKDGSVTFKRKTILRRQFIQAHNDTIGPQLVPWNHVAECTSWQELGMGNVEEVCITYGSLGQRAFKGTPFYDVTPSTRGMIFEQAARKIFDRYVECDTCDPDEVYRQPGPKGCHHGKFDWRLRTSEGHSLRVEVKSCQIGHQFVSATKTHDGNSCWALSFPSIDPELCDVVVLVAYFPDHLDFWVWDGVTGKCKQKGGKIGIQVKGRRHDCWQDFDRSLGLLIHRVVFPSREHPRLTTPEITFE